MPSIAKLIYDVGVANGDDSAYYLHLGHRVVGIEASPLAAAGLRERFRSELRDGSYTLLEIGIGDSEHEAVFWVCEDEPQWSSFHRSVASRNGSRHHRVLVQMRRFGSVLKQFGAAAYCKIDIEGNDDFCIDDMTSANRPPFLSVEVQPGNHQIPRLEELGYRRFQVISQTTLRQPSMASAIIKGHLPRWLGSMVIDAETALIRRKSHGSWRFPYGASGAFGDDLGGKWLPAEDALELNRVLEIGGHSNEWFDIHAAASAH